MSFESDLIYMLNDKQGFAVSCDYKGATYRAVFDELDKDVFSGAVTSGDFKITFFASDFPDIKNGDQVKVHGETYRVKDAPKRVADGVLKQANLGK
jgi:hypothetical protein